MFYPVDIEGRIVLLLLNTSKITDAGL